MTRESISVTEQQLDLETSSLVAGRGVQRLKDQYIICYFC